jgi:ribose transport system ATP-binding protein
MPDRLEMRAVSKSFGATQALRQVSLKVQPGEVHALIGENGAGKSTLMKILSGVFPADQGWMQLDGQPFEPQNPLHARRCGIAMIYQELNLAPHLSVEENILLGKEPARFGWIRARERSATAHRALTELRHDTIPLAAPLYRLTIAEQQIVEIARALVEQPKVLIMDEPTSSLSQVDTENLFQVIDRLRSRGVSIIYISHFLEECLRICQRYTVLRDGESVTTGVMQTANLNAIIHHMVGREMNEIYPRKPHTQGKVVLELRELAGEKKPRSVSLRLRQGEILGIAGLIGSGRTETVRACFGLDRVRAGVIVVGGEDDAEAPPSRRLAQGVGLLSENRKEEGLMLNRSLADNLTLTGFRGLARFGWIRDREQRRVARRWMTRLDIRAQSPDQPCASLSGGNQQKIALARLLHQEAGILLLDEPTRGIDVGSKAQIYQLISQLAAEGKAILFISSYLPELLGVCDTIAVMCRGVLSEVRPAAAWTEHTIIRAAIGQEEETKAQS